MRVNKPCHISRLRELKGFQGRFEWGHLKHGIGLFRDGKLLGGGVRSAIDSYG
jgi:hypothetical protein